MNKNAPITVFFLLAILLADAGFGADSPNGSPFVRGDSSQRMHRDEFPMPRVSAQNTSFADTLRLTLSPGCERDDCPDGLIVFTLNGTDPLLSSDVRYYQSSIRIDTSVILRARFVSDSSFSGYSSELVRRYEKIKALPAPHVDTDGGEFVISETITLTVPGYLQDTDIQIYYTLDGQDPLMHGKLYRSPLTITDTTTLKAVAVSRSGTRLNSSQLSRRFVRIYPTLPSPVISPVDTNFSSSLPVTITVPGFRSDSLIRLTCRMQQGDSLITRTIRGSTLHMIIDSTTTLRAYATHQGYSTSHTTAARFVEGGAPVVATPRARPRGGEFSGEPVSVTLENLEPQAMVTYTLDGSEPTKASRLYQGEPVVIHDRCTLQIRAFKTNMEPSAIQQHIYTFAKLPPPVASVAAGTVFDDTLKVALSVPGFEHDSSIQIFYSLQGLKPTDSSAVYEDTLVISRSTTLNMFAAKSYYEPSDMSTVDYFCSRMVSGAWYEDRDGDGRIETAVIELDGYVRKLPTRIDLTDPFGKRNRIFAKSQMTRLPDSVFGKSVFSVSIQPPFDFGTDVPFDQWGRIPLSGDFDIQPFTVLDRAGPVIQSAEMKSSGRASRDTLIVTFSEPIQASSIRGKRPDQVFDIVGPMKSFLESGAEPIEMADDSSCRVIFTEKISYAALSSRNTIRLATDRHVPVDDAGNGGRGGGRAIEITAFRADEWDLLAISPFTPGVDQIPSYVSALPGIQSNTGTVIMISSSGMPQAFATIYDATGNVIRKELSFVYGNHDGRQYLVWDGKNSRGEYVSSGTYLVAVRLVDSVLDGRSSVKYIKIAVAE
ncbi:MAG: chitobiase/beta-hexosaminidase C-terminal domain-containing protein [Chitinivibrionales bacterium]